MARLRRSRRRPPISSAEFNVREIVKQMLLLEDHLTDDDKYCSDCIQKHLMMIEGLAEESLTLEPLGQWVKDSKSLAKLARDVIIKFIDGVDRGELARKVRLQRKKIMFKVQDPRGNG